MLKMIVKICVCCDQPFEVCKFQRGLRAFNLDKFAETLTEMREVPPDV